MQPAIGINANGLAGKLLEITWFVDGLEQWQKPCIRSACIYSRYQTLYIPEIPIFDDLPLTRQA